MPLGTLYDAQVALIAAQTATLLKIRDLDNQVEGARYTGRNDVVTNDTDTNVHAVLALMDTLITAVATLNTEIQKEDGVFYKRIEALKVSDSSRIDCPGTSNWPSNIDRVTIKDVSTIALIVV